MIDKNTDFFEIIDHFKEIEKTPSIPIYENHLKEVPRFTIAIPTYKRVQTLKETLDSAINQDTSEEYEILVVDNNPGRQDETELLMSGYKSVSNISYYKNSKNLGMAGNWNRLAELARGKYFVLLHDDDCIAPFYLETAAAILKQNPDASLLQFKKIYDKNFKKDKYDFHVHQVRLINNVFKYYLGAPTGTIYKRNSVLELGGWNKNFYPSTDYCFDIKLIKRYKAFISPAQIVYYRREIGASNKKETKIGWISTDPILIEFLLKYLRFPGFIRNRYLEFRIEQLSKSYDLSISEIPFKINRYSHYEKKIVFNLMILVVKFVDIFLNFIHKRSH